MLQHQLYSIYRLRRSWQIKMSNYKCQYEKDWYSNTNHKHKSEEKYRKPTNEELQLHNIPSNYLTIHWNPKYKPIFLFNNVFSYKSLGRLTSEWMKNEFNTDFNRIYFADTWCNKLSTFESRIRTANKVLKCTKNNDEKDIIKDFLDASDRIGNKIQEVFNVYSLNKNESKLNNEMIVLVHDIFNNYNTLYKIACIINKIDIWTKRYAANINELINKYKLTQ